MSVCCPTSALYPEAPVLQSEPRDCDEVLALQLQQELDREAVEAQTVDLEDGGHFFCQLCHKDLSHMTPDGRTQHLNRCGRLQLHLHLHRIRLTDAQNDSVS